MKCYTPSDLQAMDRYVRANFVNCLSGFKPAALIVSQDKNGLSNVALFNNIVHLGADPALIGFINRPREATPHTLGNIESTGYYTINHINPSQISAAHQTSAKYPTGVSEFEKVELVEQFRPEFRHLFRCVFLLVTLYPLKWIELNLEFKISDVFRQKP